MTHNEFLKKLIDYGIVIAAKCVTIYDSRLFANDIMLSVSEYEPFGYYCGGAYCPHGILPKENYSDNDIQLAVKSFIEVQNREIVNRDKNLTYWDITDYLKQYPTKTKLLNTQIEKVLEILKDDFNDMLRFKKSNKK